jgi:hypothetical protein
LTRSRMLPGATSRYLAPGYLFQPGPRPALSWLKAPLARRRGYPTGAPTPGGRSPKILKMLSRARLGAGVTGSKGLAERKCASRSSDRLLDTFRPSRNSSLWSRGVARWFRWSLSVADSFVCRCLTSSTMLPFPHPAHRTGRADLPHPALGEDSHNRHSHCM